MGTVDPLNKVLYKFDMYFCIDMTEPDLPVVLDLEVTSDTTASLMWSLQDGSVPFLKYQLSLVTLEHYDLAVSEQLTTIDGLEQVMQLSGLGQFCIRS